MRSPLVIWMAGEVCLSAKYLAHKYEFIVRSMAGQACEVESRSANVKLGVHGWRSERWHLDE